MDPLYGLMILGGTVLVGSVFLLIRNRFRRSGNHHHFKS